MDKIKVLIFEPNKRPYLALVQRDVRAYSKLIGSEITSARIDSNTAIIYSDKPKKPNRMIGEACICGKFFLATYDNEVELKDIGKTETDYYVCLMGKPQNITEKEYEAHIAWSDNKISTNTVYINDLNIELFNCNDSYKEIFDSYNTEDKTSAKIFLKKMNDIFINAFGTNDVDEIETEGFINLPAVFKSKHTGEIMIGLVEVDTKSSGEHWGTDFVLPKGFVDPENAEGELKEIIHNFGIYDYWYTPIYDGDIHTDISEAPDDVMELINYARGIGEQTQAMNMDSM